MAPVLKNVTNKYFKRQWCRVKHIGGTSMFTNKKNNSLHLSTAFDKGHMKIIKIPYLKLATIMAASLSTHYALAACTISPNNNYEFIQSIKVNGASLTNETVLDNGDIVELTPGYSDYAYKDDWSMWLDFNNDGDFADSNELVFSSSTASNSAVTFTLDMPSNSQMSSTGLRVVFHATTINSDSCNYSGYGDSKDFFVDLGQGGVDTLPGNPEEYSLLLQPRGGDDEHIFSVEINNEDYVSGNNNGYANFTDEKTFTIRDNDTITLTPVSSWNTDWAVWLDSDNDGNFESNEKVFSGDGQRDDVVQGVLDLSDIAVGTTRMRIAMNGDGTAQANGFTYGEIEDYTAIIQSGGETDNGGADNKNYGSHVQWQHSSVKVKIFRFEFSDAELTWSKSRIESEMSEIKDYFDKESFGRFDVNYEIYNDVIQVNDRVSVWDNKEPNDWKDYFADKLISLGESNYWDIDDDTIYLILAPQISDWGIKAGVNPGAIRLYDTGDERSQAGGIAHEMGHAMGLHHAQGLDGQDTVFGVGDYDKERIGYGNAFSLMGANAWEFGGLNLYYKNFFKSWNIKAEVPEVTQSGTYRIYALDQGSIGGNLGLKLKAGNGDVTYWLEYRTNDGADTNGILINTEGYFPDEDSRSFYYGTSFLLDMTPNTFPDDLADEYDDFDDFYDAALTVGKSYTDKWAAFTVTVKRTGGTVGTAGAWIELDVEMH